MEATNAITAAKDVNELTDENTGKRSRGMIKGTIIRRMPMGCIYLIGKTGVAIKVRN